MMLMMLNYVNASKTQLIGFNQQGSKSVKSFTYLGSKINSAEKDMKIYIAKRPGRP